MTDTARGTIQIYIVITPDMIISMCKLAPYYDPSTGRFISEDPIRDGLNWYVYCENKLTLRKNNTAQTPCPQAFYGIDTSYN